MKKTPPTRMRTCRGCNKKFAQNTLIRFSINEEGEVQETESGGRGYYCCDNKNCKKQSLNPGKINHFLKRKTKK